MLADELTIQTGEHMEKLKLYTVIKPSLDGTFQMGDFIWLSENGDLNNVKAGGWLSKDEWDVDGTNDFAVEECKTHRLLIVSGEEMIVKNELLM